eukprot:Pgem_evm1s12058
MACGVSVEVRGDGFVARIRETPTDEYARMDFRLAECESKANWVQEAAIFNKKKAEGMVKDGKITEKVVIRTGIFVVRLVKKYDIALRRLVFIPGPKPI